MATATSSQGENRTCTAKLTMMTATMAMKARAMIQPMVIRSAFQLSWSR